MITVRKVKLIVNSEDSEEINRTYKFIRDSMYAQYQGLNRCMAYLLSGYYANGMDIKSDGFRNHMKTIKNSLNIIIPELQNRGYTFVTIPELFYYKEITLEKGMVYGYAR